MVEHSPQTLSSEGKATIRPLAPSGLGWVAEAKQAFSANSPCIYGHEKKAVAGEDGALELFGSLTSDYQG